MYNWLKKPSVSQKMYNQTEANDMYKWSNYSKTESRTQTFSESAYTDKSTDSSSVMYSSNSADNTKSSNLDISNKNLEEAIIWSEILGKPACKRRKRRYQCQ